MAANKTEKWKSDGNAVYHQKNKYATARTDAEAKTIVEAANAAIDQAFAAGLEAGRNTICKTIMEGRFLHDDSPEKRFANQVVAMIKRIQWDNPRQAMVAVAPSVKPTTPAPDEPAPMALTDAERVIWGHVYREVLISHINQDLTHRCEEIAAKHADAAIAAIRARSAPGQEPVEVVELKTRIAELETQVSKATAAERERCAGVAHMIFTRESTNIKTAPDSASKRFAVGGRDIAKTIKQLILNPTT